MKSPSTLQYPIFQRGNTVFNYSAAGAGSMVQNNVFTSSRGYGIRNCPVNCTIQGNTFTDSTDPAIRIAANYYYLAGPMPTGIRITGNTFNELLENVPQIQIETYASSGDPNNKVALVPSIFRDISDLWVSNNTFANSAVENITISGATNVILNNNRVAADGSVQRGRQGAALSIANASGISVSGFTVIDTRFQTTSAILISPSVDSGPVGLSATGTSLNGIPPAITDLRTCVLNTNGLYVYGGYGRGTGMTISAINSTQLNGNACTQFCVSQGTDGYCSYDPGLGYSNCQFNANPSSNYIFTIAGSSAVSGVCGHAPDISTLPQLR